MKNFCVLYFRKSGGYGIIETSTTRRVYMNKLLDDYLDGVGAEESAVLGEFDLEGYINHIKEQGSEWMNTPDSSGYSRVDLMKNSAEGYDKFYLITWVDDVCNRDHCQRWYEVVKTYKIKKDFFVCRPDGEISHTVKAGTYFKGVDWTAGVGNELGNMFDILDYIKN